MDWGIRSNSSSLIYSGANCRRSGYKSVSPTESLRSGRRKGNKKGKVSIQIATLPLYSFLSSLSPLRKERGGGEDGAEMHASSMVEVTGCMGPLGCLIAGSQFPTALPCSSDAALWPSTCQGQLVSTSIPMFAALIQAPFFFSLRKLTFHAYMCLGRLSHLTTGLS